MEQVNVQQQSRRRPLQDEAKHDTPTTTAATMRYPVPFRSFATFLVVVMLFSHRAATAFVPSYARSSTSSAVSELTPGSLQRYTPTTATTSPTALNVWWFGGTEQSDNSDGESCELVAVRIERTSANSRRIAGEITVPAPVDAVWSILTDYNRLAIHVPNLMESKVMRENGGGSPGDGSYKCRLYQVGAQKIIGFDFSASVTMDMTERIITSAATEARKIDFKCVDSQFFSEFDGAWTVKEQRNPVTGESETLCSYVVDVRPKGPVPVAALEWRIREDVPTNLRAVKAATVGMDPAALAAVGEASTRVRTPVTAVSANGEAQRPEAFPVRVANRNPTSRSRQVPAPRLASVVMDWDVDETMGKYL